MNEIKPKLVCLRPKYEQATDYGSYHFEHKVIEHALDHGRKVLDLFQVNATRENLRQALKDFDTVFVCGCVHGNPWQIAGQDNKIIFDVRNPDDVELMKGKHASFLSCEFGCAADAFVAGGALSFFGYRVVYWFVTGAYPNSVAEHFFGSHCTYERNFDEGEIPSECFKRTDLAYAYHITQTPDWVARYLINDRQGMYLAVKEDTSPWKPIPEEFKCCKCGVIYHDCDQLIEHIKQEHILEEFKCCRCSAVYSNCDELLNHMRKEHFPPCPEYKACVLPKFLRNLLGCSIP